MAFIRIDDRSEGLEDRISEERGLVPADEGAREVERADGKTLE